MRNLGTIALAGIADIFGLLKQNPQYEANAHYHQNFNGGAKRVFWKRVVIDGVRFNVYRHATKKATPARITMVRV